MRKKSPKPRSAADQLDGVITEQGGDSLAVQYFREACDVNLIISKIDKGIEPQHLNSRKPEFIDTTQFNSFHDALNVVKNAEETFNQLDVYTQGLVGGDAEQFLEYLDDPENREEAEKLGLLPESKSVPTPPEPPAPPRKSEGEPPPPDIST